MGGCGDDGRPLASVARLEPQGSCRWESLPDMPGGGKFLERCWAPCKAPQKHRRYKKTNRKLYLGSLQDAQKALKKFAAGEAEIAVLAKACTAEDFKAAAAWRHMGTRK